MEIPNVLLPADVADRLLAGEHGAHPVGRVLAAASRSATATELAGEAAARHAFAASRAAGPVAPVRGRHRLRKDRALFTAKAVGAAALALTAGGVAVAATGPSGGASPSVTDAPSGLGPAPSAPGAPHSSQAVADAGCASGPVTGTAIADLARGQHPGGCAADGNGDRQGPDWPQAFGGTPLAEGRSGADGAGAAGGAERTSNGVGLGRAPGSPGPGSPGSNSPGPGSPGSNSPGPGSPGSNSPGPGSPGSHSPGSGEPRSGVPAPGSPGTGTPAPGGGTDSDREGSASDGTGTSGPRSGPPSRQQAAAPDRAAAEPSGAPRTTPAAPPSRPDPGPRGHGP